MLTRSWSSSRSACTLLFLNLSKQPPEVLYEKIFLKNFARFIGKQEKEILAQVLSFKFCKIFKNNFFTEHLRWLLVSLLISKSSQLQMFSVSVQKDVLPSAASTYGKKKIDWKGIYLTIKDQVKSHVTP